MPTPLEVVAALVFGVVMFGAGYVYRIQSQLEPPAGPVESYLEDRRAEVREQYTTGDISREQFAAEVGTIEDPATEEIMHLARDVDGVGPHIAYKIAREFDDVEALAEADREDLEAINRVGENRARAVIRRVEDGRSE